MPNDIRCDYKEQEAVSDMKLAIEKCNNDLKCKAIHDWDCDGKNVLICGKYLDHPGKTQCSYAKGVHFIVRICKLLYYGIT